MLAIGVEGVAEVLPAPRITRVPQSPSALAGVANLRGRVAPILAIDVLLGQAAGDAASRVIVLDRADPIGLAVDRVGAMRTVESRRTDGARGAELVQTADGVARLLDLERLLADAFGALAGRARRARAAGPAADPAAPAAASEESIAFLEFLVAGQVYALPLEQVLEVTSLAAETTALPGSDDVMVGVTPHRGALLALVSVRAVLGLPPMEQAAAPRVVVAALGEARLGLVVDGVRAILRAQPHDVGAVPAVLNRGAGEARIDAIVQTPQGLVSILAAERILEEESVAQVIAEGAGRRSEAAADADQARTDLEQFVLFRLGDETYGLPIAAVVEVLRLPETVTRVPRAPRFVAGVMSHRGTVVPLVDQGRRFVSRQAGPERQRRVIITRLDGLTAGFIVDGVEQILSVPAAELQPAPDLAAGENRIFDRVANVRLDGRLVLLVDPRQLLDQAERDILRALAERSEPGPA